MLEEIKTFCEVVQQHSLAKAARKLGVSAPMVTRHLWLTPALNQFCKKFPNVNLQIVRGNHLINFIPEGFDLVIHCGTLPDSRFYFRKIREWKKLTCASPAYLKKFGTPKKPSDLLQHNCLDHYDNRFNSWRYVVKGNDEEVFVNGNIKTNSSIDLKNLAAAGIGLVYLPDFTVMHEIKNKKLTSVLESFSPPALGMYAVYPSKQYLSQKTKALLDFITELLE